MNFSEFFLQITAVVGFEYNRRALAPPLRTPPCTFWQQGAPKHGQHFTLYDMARFEQICALPVTFLIAAVQGVNFAPYGVNGD